MNLFQKGLLAFTIVILVAVATVAIVTGYRAETAFRHYAALYSGRTQMLAQELIGYYEQQRSWSGLQDVLPELAVPGRGRGRQGGPAPAAGPDAGFSYRVADAQQRIVAATSGELGGMLSSGEAAAALRLTVGDETIGFLVPGVASPMSMSLDEPADAFLARLRWALLLGGGVAFLAALLMAGLMTRSIVAPVRALTRTAETLSRGQFDVRADVRGSDEIARLGMAFNQMASNLQQAEEARRAQTADIAHELRNPLAVLQSSLEALADGIYEPTPENIEPALGQVRTLNGLVEDLRTLALADAGQLRLDRQPMDVGQLALRVGESFRERFNANRVGLEISVAEYLPQIPGDYARLTQVLNNILNNAVRFVPAGCGVALTVVHQDGGVTVRVADNGSGVPAEALPRLFDRFWRGEPSRARDTGGSGLGLAIADQIVQAHNGRIWAEPTPGGGLTVCFWLPSGS